MQNYPNLNVDLSNCDREPIHVIGRVQPHGFMLILNSKTLTVEQLSENISSFLDVDPALLYGNTLEVLTTAGEYSILEAILKNVDNINPQLLQVQGKQFFGFIHQSEGRLVVECEPYQRNATDLEVLAFQSKYTSFLSTLNSLDSLAAQADLVVGYVQQVLNYDRVMLYRFDEEWNGEVIAEEVVPGSNSYLHQHFPASDIPAQARALLEVKHVRQIPDAKAKAVHIAPYINPRTGEPANIILSELRNPSEIHLEYLANMEVQATLSVSIMVQGKLWGIIACQHLSPVFIDFWKRQMCLWAAQAFANAILAGQEKKDMQLMASYKGQEEKLISQVIESKNIVEGLFNPECNLLSITGASGAAISINKRWYTIGDTPAAEELQELVKWLSVTKSELAFHTRQLSAVYPPAEAYKTKASGLLALEISKYNKEYILYFKPEIQETRIWAGNPEKPYDMQKVRMHPRKSFEKWAQVVRGKSLPWTLNELEITQVMLKDVVAFILRSQAVTLKNLNNELTSSADALKAKNKRLEDFAHIITHNLRSPMNNIRGLYNLYQAEPELEVASEVIHRINGVIDNMAATIDDLNLIVKSELSRELVQQEVNLEDVISKELENLQSILMQTDAVVTTDLQEHNFFVPKVYLESIAHNLLSNALKYRSPHRRPEIHIKSWKDNGQLCFAVSDNGQGMDMEKVEDKLFNLYTTFHKNKDAKGLGLYLTKVQTETLGGSISVKSEPAVGSTFTVCLQAPKA
ncbi:ATP-binding protein [uncultured Pontibacter sp.]|uniref:ATP-binding protein n=1 Tax=uncultured Pontibacter sp. TaxID=453356 RepID=UPI0026044E01|nr:ATP-binding protein [uncultured Pontibacter sp.]